MLQKKKFQAEMNLFQINILSENDKTQMKLVAKETHFANKKFNFRFYLAARGG